MGVLGEMFPGQKITDEAGEAGDGQGWKLGPIDLDNNVVVVHRGEDEPPLTPTVETAVRAVDFEQDRTFQTGPAGPPQG